MATKKTTTTRVTAITTMSRKYMADRALHKDETIPVGMHIARDNTLAKVGKFSAPKTLPRNIAIANLFPITFKNYWICDQSLMEIQVI